MTELWLEKQKERNIGRDQMIVDSNYMRNIAKLSRQKQNPRKKNRPNVKICSWLRMSANVPTQKFDSTFADFLIGSEEFMGAGYMYLPFTKQIKPTFFCHLAVVVLNIQHGIFSWSNRLLKSIFVGGGGTSPEKCHSAHDSKHGMHFIRFYHIAENKPNPLGCDCFK